MVVAIPIFIFSSYEKLSDSGYTWLHWF